MQCGQVYMRWIAIAASLLTAVQPMSAGASTPKCAGQTLSLGPVIAAGQAPTTVSGSIGDISQPGLDARHKPGNAYTSSHYERALNYKQHGDVDKALVEFLKATQEILTCAKAFWEQALIFRDRGFLKLAQSALMQALTVKPDYNEARLLLAVVRLEQGDFSGCATDLSRMLGIQPPKFMDFKNSSKPPQTNEVKDSAVADFEHAPSVMQMPHYYLPVPKADVIDEHSGDNQNQDQTNAARRQALSAYQSPDAGQDASAAAGMTRTVTSSLPVSEFLKGIPGIDPSATANGDTHSEVKSGKVDADKSITQGSVKTKSSLFHFSLNPFARSKPSQGNQPAVPVQTSLAGEIHKQQVEAIKRVMQGQQESNREQIQSGLAGEIHKQQVEADKARNAGATRKQS